MSAFGEGGARDGVRSTPTPPKNEANTGREGTEDLSDGGVDDPPDVEGGDREVGAAPPTRTGRLRSVVVEMSGMDDDVGSFVQLRLVSAGQELLAIGTMHELPSEDYTFEFTSAAPSGEALSLLVWANSTGTMTDAYDGGRDHAWMLAVPAGERDARVQLEHGAQTAPIDLNGQTVNSYGSLNFEMLETDPWYEKPFELRVFQADSGRLVGRHMRAVPGGTTSFEVFGIIRNGVRYRVDFAIDDDARANGFRGDPAWSREVTGSATGFAGMPGAQVRLSRPPPESEYVDVEF